MGKKSKLKQIRKIASQLPAIPIQRVVGEPTQGADLIKSGTDKLKDGTLINPDKMYSKKRVVSASLNHTKKMKKMYNKYGLSGVQGYINAVQEHVKGGNP